MFPEDIRSCMARDFVNRQLSSLAAVPEGTRDHGEPCQHQLRIRIRYTTGSRRSMAAAKFSWKE
jgi:hypothetical protein